MRCLFVSPEPITRRSGGGIAMLQSIIAISSFSEIDIIAPEVSNININNPNIRIMSTYQWDNISVFKRIMNMIFYGRPRFVNIKEVKNKIQWNRYDFAFFEFPWNYLLMEEAKKRDLPVFCRFHNTEGLILMKQVVKERKLGFLLMLLRCPIAERKAISTADGIVFLKEEDKIFYEKKYKNQNIKQKACVIPISIIRKKRTLFSKNNKTVLFAAQLSYGPNREGLLWLIDTAWKEIANMDFTLLIAGGNADKKLREMLKCIPNIKTFYDPTENEIENLYEQASFSIAPIFWGSGMKVKIAESLARGIVPIGTPEAFSGYEIENNKNAFVFRHKQGLYGIFCKINKMTFLEMDIMSKSALDLFEKKYEISTCVNVYKKFIFDTINEKKA